MSGTVTEPLHGAAHGFDINVGRVTFAGTDAVPIPNGVTDWTYFRGALLVTLVRDIHGTLANGSATMIAPGLAVTATHTVSDYAETWAAGEASILCAGPTPSGLVIWRVASVTISPADDIAYLSLALASEPPSSPMGLRLFPITTRTPRIGERVHVLGFRLDTLVDTTNEITVAGDLYAAAGEVTAVHHPTRDSVLMPYPTIEVACGSLGAMSGGPVLDDHGFVFGIVGRGFNTVEGDGPTSAPWIIGGLDRAVSIPWPPDQYPDEISVLDIHDDFVRIEGRDRLRRTPKGIWRIRRGRLPSGDMARRPALATGRPSGLRPALP